MNYPHLSLFVKRVTHSQSQDHHVGLLTIIFHRAATLVEINIAL